MQSGLQPFFDDKAVLLARSVKNANGFDDRLIFGQHGSVGVLNLGVLADLVDDVQALRHISKARILPVQIGAILVDNEKLGGSAVHIA